MTQEMLPEDIFTRSRRPWKARVQIKHLLPEDEDLTPDEIGALGAQIAKIMSTCDRFDNDNILYTLALARDVDTFDGAMEQLYDECDAARIWVE